MKFLEINFNKWILISESFFKDNNQKNIDFLNNVLFFDKINEFHKNKDFLEDKLKILEEIIKSIEKFHSYFHFEQAFFHFFYADFLSNFNSEKFLEKIIQNFELSIKQFKFNEIVFMKYIEFCKKNLLEDKTNELIKKFEDLFHKKYESYYQNNILKKQFKSFEDYIMFALDFSKEEISKIQKEILEQKSEKNFYNCFENFENLSKDNRNYSCKNFLNKTTEVAESSIQLISDSHQKYHENAAKIYWNYFLVLKFLDKEIESKNILNKVKNLDPKLLENF